MLNNYRGLLKKIFNVWFTSLSLNKKENSISANITQNEATAT